MNSELTVRGEQVKRLILNPLRLEERQHEFAGPCQRGCPPEALRGQGGTTVG